LTAESTRERHPSSRPHICFTRWSAAPPGG